MDVKAVSNKSANKKITTFFLITFLFSWLLWLPGMLATLDIINLSGIYVTIDNISRWIAGLGPSLAAIILIIKFEGKSGLKKIWARVFDFRLGSWYWPLFLILPAVIILAHLLNVLFFKGSFPATGLLKEPWWIPVLFLVFLVMQFSEELGWRGYALDLLQKRWNALVSSVILGFFWAGWHLPMFLTSGFTQHDYHLPFLQFAITLILCSILITWIQNNTHSSLLPAFVFHALINLSGEVLPLFEKNPAGQGSNTAWIISNTLLFIIVITVIYFWGPKRLMNDD